jgi:hypothetical protein
MVLHIVPNSEVELKHVIISRKITGILPPNKSQNGQYILWTNLYDYAYL